MTDAVSNLELNETSGRSAGIQQWADVFYGVLVAPQQTMAVLADNSLYKSDGAAFVCAALTVFTSSLLSIIGACGGDMSFKSQLCIVAGLFFAVANWTMLSSLLYLIARIVSAPNKNIGSAFVVVGWAYLPIYFINPIKCLSSVPVFGVLTVFALIGWMIFLECVAYKSVLNFNCKRTIALFIAVPVLYKFTLLCGLIFLLAVAF